MMQCILSILKPADNALQNRTTGINTLTLIGVVDNQLIQERTDEKFEELWSSSTKLMSSDPPREVRRKKTPSSRLIYYFVTESVGNSFDDESSTKVTIKRYYKK